MKQLLGILTFLATISLIVVLVVLSTQGVMFKASMVKLGILNLAVVIVLCGFYLVKIHHKPNKMAKLAIWTLGAIIVFFAALLSFEIVDAKSTWNILIGLGIVYITLVQLQLLKWGKSKSILKILGLITLLSNIFISVYFLFELKMQYLGIVLDVTVISSVFAFLIGIILSRDKKKAIETPQA